MPTIQYLSSFRRISQIHLFSFWAVVIIGHAFFITTIVDIFKKKEIDDTENEQPPGILDGIIDEY